MEDFSQKYGKAWLEDDIEYVFAGAYESVLG